MRSAQVLAQTGHIAYFGWASAMIGWQLFVAYPFIKIFGATPDAMRLSVLLVATMLSFVLHRAFRRAGLTEWNATIGVIAFLGSPVLLPIAFSYMTDVPGLFSIALCLYGCLRTVQAGSDRSAAGWIWFAALASALTGTARQVAWLGVLVLCPSTLWLLRKRRAPLLAGVAATLTGWAIVLWCMRWFTHQPFSREESLNIAAITRTSLARLLSFESRLWLTSLVLLLPLLCPYLLRLRKKQAVLLAVALVLPVTVLGLKVMVGHQHLRISTMLFPNLGNYWSVHGAVDGTPIKGTRPVVLGSVPRFLLNVVTLTASAAFVVVSWTTRHATKSTVTQARLLSWRELNVLCLPINGAYLLLTVPRALIGDVFDRYALVLVLFGVVYVLRIYQTIAGDRVSRLALIALVVYAGIAIANTHDAFAYFRARVAATEEVLRAGIPAQNVDGGLEFNGMTQIALGKTIQAPRVESLTTSPAAKTVAADVCRPLLAPLIPLVQPRFAISFDPVACGGPTAYAPSTYHAWLGQHTVSIYVVRILPSGSGSTPL